MAQKLIFVVNRKWAIAATLMALLFVGNAGVYMARSPETQETALPAPYPADYDISDVQDYTLTDIDESVIKASARQPDEPNIVDVIQALTGLITAVTGLVAAFKGVKPSWQEKD